MSLINYRTINIDALDPESSTNFPMETLLPATLPQPASGSDAANAATQVRQMLRTDPEGALRAVLDMAPLGGDDQAKEVHLATVIDVLQGIRQGEMTRILEGVCSGDGGAERADCLMKYLYVDYCCELLEEHYDEHRSYVVPVNLIADTLITGTRECLRVPPVVVLRRRRSQLRPKTRASRRSRLAIWPRVPVVSR